MIRPAVGGETAREAGASLSSDRCVRDLCLPAVGFLVCVAKSKKSRRRRLAWVYKSGVQRGALHMTTRWIQSRKLVISSVGVLLLGALVSAQDGNGVARYRPAPPDASGAGGSSTTSAEYRLSAVQDLDIAPDGRFTEVWARVYRPDPLPANSPP